MNKLIVDDTLYLSKGDIFLLNKGKNYDVNYLINKAKEKEPSLIISSLKNKEIKHIEEPYSETGGIAYKVPGHSYFDGLFGHKIAKTKENYNKKYFNLYNKLLKQVQKGTLIGIINTEVADCEIEYNGIFTYDRKVLKVYEDKLIKLNKKISDCED